MNITDKFKLIAKYFGISYNAAMNKYSELKRDNLLESILKEAEEGKVLPPTVCPNCGKEMKLRLGKNGRFYGCVGFPECKGTRTYEGPDLPPGENEVKNAHAKIALTMKFITEIGGVDQATRWLNIAAQSLGN